MGLSVRVSITTRRLGPFRIAACCYDAIPLGYLGVDLVVDAELGPMVLELNARPGLTIQLANRRGLRASMETLVAADLNGATVEERLALARRLATDDRS